jgi:hypothetical protein
MTATIISWRTTKQADGYRWQVYSFGYQIAEAVLKEGVCATRAQATGIAQRWTRHLKAQARKVA